MFDDVVFLIIGFAIGYGVREMISRHRRRKSNRRRADTQGAQLH
jgi:hypothetical protein